jgi:hypothetical protein
MPGMEPDPRVGGIEEGLAARIHDPLWLLCRQWQLGELRADDSGSPYRVDVAGRKHAIDSWRAGTGGEWQSWNLHEAPLERLVEQEPEYRAADPQLRLEGGVRWARALTGSPDVATIFRDKCGWAAAAAYTARGLSAALQAKTPDGALVASSLRRLTAADTADAEAITLGLDDGARATVLAAAVGWLAWWDPKAPATAVAPTSLDPVTWDPNRYEHAFALRSSTLPEVELVASEYVGERLDWTSFDVAAPTDPPADPPASPPEATELRLTGIPSSARFGGMPAPRFWEMEDAQFDPGAVDAAPHDLGRLLLATYATVYGNDWCVVPLRLPVGTLIAVDQFTVTDVFGATSSLKPAAATDPDWNLYGITDGQRPGGTSTWFALSPSLPDSLEGPPMESVLLARDEMANLAWAVELEVEDSSGHATRRRDAWAARTRAEPAPNPFTHYRVETDVPDYWFPLAPEQLSDQESVRLRLVPLVRRDPADPGHAVLPNGQLLALARGDGNRLWIHEEEVPRSGALVTRRRQRARWHDGSVHNWIARRKQPGTGESSSGLQFDIVDPPTA